MRVSVISPDAISMVLSSAVGLAERTSLAGMCLTALAMRTVTDGYGRHGRPDRVFQSGDLFYNMPLGLHVELDPLKSDKGQNAFVDLIYPRSKSAEF